MPPANRVPAGAMEQMIGALQSGQYPFWFPRQARGQAIDYFVYATDFTPLGASATVTNNVNINGDSAFCILSAVLVETDTANTTFLMQRPLMFALKDSSAGREFSNVAIAADNWFGTAEEPKYWDVPKILAPNGTLSVTAQNLEATARNIRVAFHGFKIFGFRPS